MRFVRYLIAAFAIVVIIAGLAIVLAMRNQDRLVHLVLERINERTGYNIVTSGNQIAFRAHLVVILNQPRILTHGIEIASLKDIRAVVSYHALIYQSGLPLHALIMNDPEVHLPPSVPPFSEQTLPALTPAVVEKTSDILQKLSDIALRFDVDNGKVIGHRGRLLIDHFDVSARRQHRRPGNWPWLLSFDAGWENAPFAGLRVTGNLQFGQGVGVPPQVMAGGRLWFWGMSLDRVRVTDTLQATVKLQGDLNFTLKRDGDVDGGGAVDLARLVLQGKALSEPLKLGNFSLGAQYQASPQSLSLTDVKLRQGNAQLLAGECTVNVPYQPLRTVSFRVGGLKIRLVQLKSWLRKFRDVPKAVLDFAGSLDSGQLTLVQSDFASAEPVNKWTFATFRNDLRIDANLTGVGFTPPPNLKLPPVTQFGTQLIYAGNTLDLRQGSGRIGQSSFTDMEITADLRRAPHEIAYRAQSRGHIDFGEVYPAALQTFGGKPPPALEHIETVGGDAPFRASGRGKVIDLTPRLPTDYEARIDTGHLQFQFKGAPGAIALKGGEVTLTPNAIALKRVVAIPFDNSSDEASAVINGRIVPRAPTPLLSGFTVELHQLSAAKWLPILVDPHELGVDGEIGGRLVANSSRSAGKMPVVTGELTMGRGTVQFGFFRSPIEAQSATLALNGKGLVFEIPAGQLEGSPVNLKLTVGDFSKPVLRIDASAERLDFEVMKFIRLPWSPKSPSKFFPFPTEGHIEANYANFDKLQMSKVSTDFTHDKSNWRVYNFKAKTLGGSVKLQISGRAADDWIRIKGRVVNMDAASVFLLSGKQKSSPLLGRLFAAADLWADTGKNFFNTLAGTASVDVRDGTLDKFTLLTRILSFIDLKNWLTANLPDPTAVGIPFKTLTASFKGQRGDFYTDNLRLDGPVMDIVARGDVRFGDGTMDMRIALIPFNTVNWLVNKIPVIGENIASGSNDLVAAYFQVRGPVSDPHVTPKPITSVAEFVAKTLSLPINIIAPDTIKP